MNLKNFATQAKPLRCSKLAMLMRCPMKEVLSMDADDDLGGVAAQTGSVVHKAIEAFHLEDQEGKKVQAGLDALQASLPLFPDAEKEEALRHFIPYAQDPRNRYAEFAKDKYGKKLIELELFMQIAPHESDSTGQPIVIRGAIDQIRVEQGVMSKVWDVKTGKPSGWEMIHEYAIQQAAYTILALVNGVDDINVGGIIRTNGYRVRGAELPSPNGVFWNLPFSLSDCFLLIDRIRLEVANIRNGEINWGPSPICTFCEHGGLSRCLQTAKEKWNFDGYERSNIQKLELRSKEGQSIRR